MRLATITDLGKRKSNQDSFWASRFERNGNEYTVLMVCDGMGGMEDGDIASKVTVKTVKEELLKSKSPDIAVALLSASRSLYMTYGGQTGTTATVAVFSQGQYLGFHAGDTRMYKLSNSQGNHRTGGAQGVSVELLTEDHTAYARMVRAGVPNPDPRLESRLTNAIGATQTPHVDTFMGSYRPGDQFLACSDGFWHLFKDDPESLKAFDWASKDGLKEVITVSQSRGEGDNMTAAGVEF